MVSERNDTATARTRDDAELLFLRPDAQTADDVLARLLQFVDGATSALDLAVYDAHLGEGRAQRLIAALDAAEARGVRIRAVYNEDAADRRRRGTTAPTGPSLLPQLREAVPAKAIDGVPDLMHHKYVVRDRTSVWTGSANWTDDSWQHQENLVVVIDNPGLAAAFTHDFEQLWQREEVEGSGDFDDTPDPMHYQGATLHARALFAPGRGKAIGQLFATRIGEAARRVRICSPVITSAPMLATLAEVVDDRRCDIRIVVDGPMMQRAIEQWQRDGRAEWKAPLFHRLEQAGVVHRKPSRPFGTPGLRDHMHAKVLVCDDVTIIGSYNCSHSGEFNAENVVELRGGPLADRCTTFVDDVYATYRTHPRTRLS
jgi:phosphatidylserine/phosphatidylglycerophosphate/cardiolipin synthase-like enzyme